LKFFRNPDTCTKSTNQPVWSTRDGYVVKITERSATRTMFQMVPDIPLTPRVSVRAVDYNRPTMGGGGYYRVRLVIGSGEPYATLTVYLQGKILVQEWSVEDALGSDPEGIDRALRDSGLIRGLDEVVQTLSYEEIPQAKPVPKEVDILRQIRDLCRSHQSSSIVVLDKISALVESVP